MAVTFTLETTSIHSIEELFAISLNIDTHVESFADSHESVIDGTMSGQIKLGESVTWRAKHFGVWFTMTSKITDLDEPEFFVDQQIRGPFRVFEHVHRFRREADQSVITDVVTLGSPVFGAVVDRLILRPYLRHIIAQRNAHLLHVLDARGGASRSL